MSLRAGSVCVFHGDCPSPGAEGADADRWLAAAQAFAGPPGAGRAPKGAVE